MESSKEKKLGRPRYAAPRSNCKHCYGRGWVGVNGAGEKVMCRCRTRKLHSQKMIAQARVYESAEKMSDNG